MAICANHGRSVAQRLAEQTVDVGLGFSSIAALSDTGQPTIAC